MKILWHLVLFTLAAVVASAAVFNNLDNRETSGRLVAALRDSLASARAQASIKRQTDSVEVIRYVRRTTFDTTRITDTAYVTEYVSRVDTLRERCLACVQSASAIETTLTVERDFWRGRYDAVKPTWWDKSKGYIGLAAGIGVGVGSCKAAR